ncbi:hypothetical protein MAUB1S_11449 [Mycolicibacterium aubagnense]
MGELMDRARAFIAVIPDEGAGIVVPTHEVGDWLRCGIKELRSKNLSRHCDMISIRHMGDCSKLWGRRPHVLISPDFMTSNVRPETKAEVEKLVRGIQVMSPIIIGIDYASQPDKTGTTL